ncbi:MAG: thermonuclease family protein [Chloroflexi bacterium]|nr:thermonuclease family protein [Chloroflexota bacterium]
MRVADGDTIVVEIGSVEARVRYIGIDTPETDIADAPNEWMAADAARANSDLVNARQVVLEMDVSQTDRFGRLLRYVWVREGGEWTMVNRELLRLGFARVTTYPPDVKYANVFRKAEAWARKKERGPWSAPTQEVVPNTMPLPLVPQSQPEQPRTGCDRSYPDVCIPPSPPDLNCGEIADRRFAVRPPDPHGFDGNFDGISWPTGGDLHQPGVRRDAHA